MNNLVNKSMLFSAVATVAGLFVYKNYISSTVKSKLGGTE